jgi:hypothetical protein
MANNASASNFLAEDSITLISDGTEWYEISRSGRLHGDFRALASSASITVTQNDRVIRVSGLTDVDNILGGTKGQELRIQWATTSTFNVRHFQGGTGQIELYNETTLNGASHNHDTNSLAAFLTLVNDGTNWNEVSRSSPMVRYRSLAAANGIAITSRDETLSLTGPTELQNLTGGLPGQHLTIIWAASATFNVADANTGDGQIHLVGNEDLTGHIATHTLDLIHDSSDDWYETGRSTQIGNYRTLSQSAALVVTASDRTMTLTANGVHVTSITGGHAGQLLDIVWGDSWTMTKGNNLKLEQNYDGSIRDTMTFVCDGTDWYETGRTNN